MACKVKALDEHFLNDGSPKRILTLDGGGLRGILSLGFLQKIEDILRDRHGGGERFRLSDYFDLIAGTSTGAIIAAALAIGSSVEEIRRRYMVLGEKVFERSLLRQGLFRAKYHEERLKEELRDFYGAGTTLGSPEVKTGLLLMTKRLDTGSPWPIGNNPRGKYFVGRQGGTIGNGEYPLWQVVRASTAAPSYFDPETVAITGASERKPVQGQFVDGGVSPFNNPALQAFMYATLHGYHIGWPTGADKLLLVSVGTGSADPEVKKANIAAKHAVNALLSLMDDCASLQETMMQWMSSSPTAREIDRELGDLRHDLIAEAPLLSYLRYNVSLSKDNVKRFDPTLTDSRIESLSAMDAPENMVILHGLGTMAANLKVKSEDFPSVFDLTAE